MTFKIERIMKSKIIIRLIPKIFSLANQLMHFNSFMLLFCHALY